MYFESLAMAIAMDGHGIYVWSVYVIFFLSIVVMVVEPVRKYRREMNALAASRSMAGEQSGRS